VIRKTLRSKLRCATLLLRTLCNTIVLRCRSPLDDLVGANARPQRESLEEMTLANLLGLVRIRHTRPWLVNLGGILIDK